jgi:uncharacterized protein (DUF1697 family)
VNEGLVDRRAALLRGINIGTAKRVAMADLRKIVEDLGYADVRTLLNSGNVVFTVRKHGSRDHAACLEQAVSKRLRVSADVIVLTRREVAAAVERNPLASIADDPARLLVVAFRDAKSFARVKPLSKESWAPEALAVGSGVAYLWCARGVGVSEVWPAVDRAAARRCTARNMATMTKLLAVLGEA